MLPHWERMQLAEKVGIIRKGTKPNATITVGVSEYSLTMPPAFHRWAQKEMRRYRQYLRQAGFTDITILFHVDTDQLPLSRGAVAMAALHAGMTPAAVTELLRIQGLPCDDPEEPPC